MRVASVKTFRGLVTRLTHLQEPVLVVRRGRPAGIFFPWTDEVLPAEFRRELFARLSQEIAARLTQAGLSEEEVLQDFEAHRKARR